MSIGSFHSVTFPWPDEPSDAQMRTAVRALQDGGYRYSGQMTNGRASQIMGMASARIEKYAPDAPLVMKREAAERFVFYLSEAPSGAIVSRSRKGMLPTADGGGHLTDLSATSQYSHAAMFKKCGAERTLRDWRVFRAAHIEKDDD